MPPSLVFYRTPISVPKPEVSIEDRLGRQKRDINSIGAELVEAASPLRKPAQPQLINIFGSVSTADIAESIKTVLSRSTEGARVVIGAEDIIISQIKGNELGVQNRGIEGDRLKVLGDFQVEVRVIGGEPVVRTVSVKAREVSQEQLYTNIMTAA